MNGLDERELWRVEEFKRLFHENFGAHSNKELRPPSIEYTLKLMSLVMDGYEVVIETVLHLKKGSFEATASVVSSQDYGKATGSLLGSQEKEKKGGG